MAPSEAAKLVAVLLQAYPQAQFAPASSATYEANLVDLDVRVANEAVQRIIKTRKWFPAIADIREVAAQIQFGHQRLGAEAFGDVLEAVRRVGSHRPAPRFKDPIVGECVRLMTWIALCLGENEAADRARFIELYEGLQDRRSRDLLAGRALALPEAGHEPPRRLQQDTERLRQLTAGVGRRVS